MRRTIDVLALLLLAAAIPIGRGEAQSSRSLPEVTGTWEVETPEGPKRLVVRSDSSASFGDEIVRWRLVPDTMYIAFGDEWVGYNYVLNGTTLTFSGGDLEEPISMVRVGPETPRAPGVEVPPAPPMEGRGSAP